MARMLPHDDEVGKARTQALKLLVRREHAPVELTRKLRQRGYQQDIVEHVVGELMDENLVSFERYAESFAYSRAQRGLGPNRIYAELRAMNVEADLIEIAISKLEIDWIESARSVRRKRFGDVRPAEILARAKQERFLQQRGFTLEQIMSVMQEVRDSD